MIETHQFLADAIKAADPGALVNSGQSMPRVNAESFRDTPRSEGGAPPCIPRAPKWLAVCAHGFMW